MADDLKARIVIENAGSGALKQVASDAKTAEASLKSLGLTGDQAKAKLAGVYYRDAQGKFAKAPAAAKINQQIASVPANFAQQQLLGMGKSYAAANSIPLAQVQNEAAKAAKAQERAMQQAERAAAKASSINARRMAGLTQAMGTFGNAATVGRISKLGTALTGVYGASLGLVAGAAAVTAFGNAVVGLGDTGQNVLMAEKRLASFAGGSANAAKAIGEISNASSGAIDTLTGMTLASQLLSMQIAKTPEDVGNIAKIATMLGSPMREASDKIQDFTMLLANNSIRRLDQFGISVADVRERAKELRAQFDGMGKEEAFQKAVVEIGLETVAKLEVAGVETATASKQLEGSFESWKQEMAKKFAGPVGNIQLSLANSFKMSAAENQLNSNDPEIRADGAIAKLEILQAKRDEIASKPYGQQMFFGTPETYDAEIERLKEIIRLAEEAKNTDQWNDVGFQTRQREALPGSGDQAAMSQALRSVEADFDRASLYIKTRSQEMIDEISTMPGKVAGNVVNDAIVEYGIKGIEEYAETLGTTLDKLQSAGGEQWAVDIMLSALMTKFDINKQKAQEVFDYINMRADLGADMDVNIRYKISQEWGDIKPADMMGPQKPQPYVYNDPITGQTSGQGFGYFAATVKQAALDYAAEQAEIEKDAAEERARIAKSAANDFNSRVKEAANNLRTGVENALTAGMEVTPADWWNTKAGTYAEKPMENARRLDAIAERGHFELIKHPDWAGILNIPPEVLAGTDEQLQAWAAQTSEDVQNFLRPDLINWDAFADQYAKSIMDAKTKEETILKGVQVLQDKNLIGPEGLTGAKDRVAELMGFKEDDDGGISSTIINKMSQSMSGFKPAQAMGTAFQTDLKDNAELFSTASASLGKDIAESIAKGVKENLSNVRYEIAAAIAPSVANILSMGGGVRAQP